MVPKAHISEIHGQCVTQTADFRPQNGGKLQTEGKIQTADQG